MKVIYHSEDISHPFDEGIKKTAHLVLHILHSNATVQGFCKYGEDSQAPALKKITTNKLLLSKSVRSLFASFQPHIILYLPSSSATFASFLRLWVMGLYAPKAKKVLLALQPKSLGFLQTQIVKIIKPDMVLSPSPQVLTAMQQMQINHKLIPLFVDTKKFKPLSNAEEKIALRKKYNLPLDKFIITHMGHLNYGRNLESLIPLQNNNVQVLILASSSTPVDAPKEEPLKQKLINAGIIIHDGYVEHIQELYQLSDLYIFPVISSGGSIGMPLSILEARACATPVLTTDYGSVKTFLDTDFGNITYSQPQNFPAALKSIRDNNSDTEKTNINALNTLFVDDLKSVLR